SAEFQWNAPGERSEFASQAQRQLRPGGIPVGRFAVSSQFREFAGIEPARAVFGHGATSVPKPAWSLRKHPSPQPPPRSGEGEKEAKSGWQVWGCFCPAPL